MQHLKVYMLLLKFELELSLFTPLCVIVAAWLDKLGV
jgi:hypothetical protein